MNYLAGFVLSFVLSVLLVPFVRRLAWKIGAIDKPQENSRKIHSKPMPRAGGLVLYASFFIPSVIFLQHLGIEFLGLFLAVTIVTAVGLLDDIYNLNPWLKLSGQVAAAVVAILCGIKITVLSNVVGGGVFEFTGSISLSIISVALSLLWLVGMTNTVNFLDGLDGLATGVAAIAGIVIFLLSISPHVNQPQTALLSIILAGACLGFLWHNFFPARIFNGDSGAYFLGMTIAILAIISGAKLATALLVLGLPILDACWAVIRRIGTGRSPFSADRGHIHFLLLDAGLNQKQSVLVIYAFSIAFGTVALLSGTRQKTIALFVLLTCTAILLTALHLRHAKLNGKKARN